MPTRQENKDDDVGAQQPTVVKNSENKQAATTNYYEHIGHILQSSFHRFLNVIINMGEKGGTKSPSTYCTVQVLVLPIPSLPRCTTGRYQY
jgi:hypothetical protein